MLKGSTAPSGDPMISAITDLSDDSEAIAECKAESLKSAEAEKAKAQAEAELAKAQAEAELAKAQAEAELAKAQAEAELAKAQAEAELAKAQEEALTAVPSTIIQNSTPEPAPAPGIGGYKGKRCDIQTLSNEKKLPKWNCEIVDTSIVASMLKDAEKTHIPFIKIDATDDVKTKLEAYLNKNLSKLNIQSTDTFSCEAGKVIKTSNNIGIQHVMCDDSETSVEFLNLISPADNKARVYHTKTFDHLFEDAPDIDKTEETVINGERGTYVAVKYETAFDATGSEHSELDIVYYLFLGDKLRYLTDWTAFHTDENSSFDEEDGTETYSCNAKATVLRIESTGAKQMTHTMTIGE